MMPLKPLEALNVCTNPNHVYVGKETTVQDLIDWINYYRMENTVLTETVRVMNDMLKPPPDNLVELKPKKVTRKRKPKVIPEESKDD
jgi:hypothetical protein